MKIGVDFYGTITKHPELFTKLLNGIENEFWIVSAVMPKNLGKLHADVAIYGLDTKIEPILFVNYDEIPHLKLQTALRLGLEIFMDDRLDTVEIMRSVGILGLHVV